MKSTSPVIHRATKIVVTLGPASSDPQLLEEMIRAGVNVVRLNFSHGSAQDHIDRARLVREAAQRAGRVQLEYAGCVRPDQSGGVELLSRHSPYFCFRSDAGDSIERL